MVIKFYGILYSVIYVRYSCRSVSCTILSSNILCVIFIFTIFCVVLSLQYFMCYLICKMFLCDIFCTIISIRRFLCHKFYKISVIFSLRCIPRDDIMSTLFSLECLFCYIYGTVFSLWFISALLPAWLQDGHQTLKLPSCKPRKHNSVLWGDCGRKIEAGGGWREKKKGASRQRIQEQGQWVWTRRKVK